MKEPQAKKSATLIDKYEELIKLMEKHYIRDNQFLTNVQLEVAKLMKEWKLSSDNYLSQSKASEIELSEKSKKVQEDYVTATKSIRTTSRLFLAGSAVASTTILGSLFGAFKFYKESIKSKAEVRDEIVRGGEKIMTTEEYDVLQSELLMLSDWVRQNPRDSRPYINYRATRIKKNGAPHYEDIANLRAR